jgi:hypothetical protein
MSSHLDFDRLFARAMDEVGALANSDVIVDDFDWSHFDRVIDVGGSKGSKSIPILKRHAHMSAVVTDRPEVIAEAKSYWAARLDRSVLDRLSFDPGDARISVPEAKSDRDVYMLNAVLHAFDDSDAGRVLANLRAACEGTGARVTINEIVLPEIGTDVAGASFDMQMFVGTRGRERTREEFHRLFAASGLSEIQDVQTRSFASMMVLGTNY